MAFSAASINMGLHACFPYMEELKRCYRDNAVPKISCSNQVEDYLECHNRKKLLKLADETAKQLRRGKIINVPHYDKANDRFVFDDGRIVENTDEIFKHFSST